MSTTDARRPVATPPGGLRGRVAWRPLTAFLRAVRWRFGAGWWAAVLLALPVLTLAVGVVAGAGLQTGDLLVTLSSGVIPVVTAVLLVHLWEETVRAGFFQGRLEQRHGFPPAAALTAVPFAAVHLPLSFIGDLAAGPIPLSIGGLLVLGALMRLLVGATVRGAAGSLLAAGIVHATFWRQPPISDRRPCAASTPSTSPRP